MAPWWPTLLLTVAFQDKTWDKQNHISCSGFPTRMFSVFLSVHPASSPKKHHHTSSLPPTLGDDYTNKRFSAHTAIHLWLLITLIKHLRDDCVQKSVASVGPRSRKSLNQPTTTLQKQRNDHAFQADKNFAVIFRIFKEREGGRERASGENDSQQLVSLI